jgi:hypothetical protein
MENKLFKLAKGENKKPNTEEVEKPKTPEEERDLKAKQTVEKLLDGVDLTPKKDEELLEIDAEPKEGTIWLEEQVALLNEQVETLTNELTQAKSDYQRLFEDYQKRNSNISNNMPNETTNQNVLTLFNELQNNLLGQNRERTVWKEVKVEHILKQMLTLFPFTATIKKF